MILTVFLTILKIIGIVLLSILGLILLVLFTVLFVPLRYGGKGSYDKENIKADVSASWLLHLVRVSFKYGIEEPLKVRILWFDPLKKKEPKPKKEKKPGKNKKKKDSIPENFEDEESEETEVPIEKPVETEEQESKIESVPESYEADSVTCESAGNDSPEIKQTVKDKYKDKHKKPSKEKSIQSDTKYGKIKGYIDLLKSPEFKKALSLCFDSLIKILKHILPRKWQVEATLGFESPDTVGTVLGIAGMFYPIFHKHLIIHPNFEEEVIDVKGRFKGHITLFTLLIIGLKVLFDKNIKKVLKMFKEA